MEPNYGIFVANRLERLLRSGSVETGIIAPVPRLPGAGMLLPRLRMLRRVPPSGLFLGRTVLHPRFLAIPKFGMARSPERLLRAILPAARRLSEESGGFDLIDAHYFYPDGVAAVRLGEILDIPVCVTARGSDLNVFPAFPAARRQIAEAAHRARGLVTVSEGLRDRLADLGIDGSRVRVLRNGVDLGVFTPAGRQDDRRALGIEGPVAIMAGNLVELKGHAIILEALRAVPGLALLVVGDGPLRSRLQRQAAGPDLAGRVRFLGARPHRELPSLYRAADALVLASSREGWPNVLLEAMACGTAVLASDIPGVREAVAGPAAGMLVAGRSPGPWAEALGQVRPGWRDPGDVRKYAEGFGWEPTTRGQIQLFEEILGRRSGGP